MPLAFDRPSLKLDHVPQRNGGCIRLHLSRAMSLDLQRSRRSRYLNPDVIRLEVGNAFLIA
jgi:hypothetical protein